MDGKFLVAAHAALQALSDEDLAQAISLAAHEMAHRQGIFEPQQFTIAVNVPPGDLPEEDDTKLIVLPGGKI